MINNVFGIIIIVLLVLVVLGKGLVCVTKK